MSLLSLEQRISLIISNAHSLKRAKDRNDYPSLVEFFTNISSIASEGATLYASLIEEHNGPLPLSQTEGGPLPATEEPAKPVRTTDNSGTENTGPY